MFRLINTRVRCSVFAVIFTVIASQSIKASTLTLGPITPTDSTQYFESSYNVLTGNSVTENWLFSLTGSAALITAGVSGPAPYSPLQFGLALYNSTGQILAVGIHAHTANLDSFDGGGAYPWFDPILSPGSYDLVFNIDARVRDDEPGQFSHYFESLGVSRVSTVPEPSTLPLFSGALAGLAGLGWKRVCTSISKQS